MKITKTVTINKPAEQVWKLIAHDFEKAYLWMDPIPHSYGIGEGNGSHGAPMEGRMCNLSDDPEGAKVKEIITHYNEQDKTLAFDVFPVNNPAIIPIKQNSVQMTVKPIGANQSEVIWIASPQLKRPAYLFYPLLRIIFPLAFAKLLKGLKVYAESTSLDAKPAVA